MSSILFDPATTAGNAAGTRTTPIPSGHSPGSVSFDALLAKSQSKHDAAAAYGSDRYNDERDYDSGRDDKAERIADDDIDRDSEVSSEWDDSRSEDWDDSDKQFDDPAGQEVQRDTSDTKDDDPGVEGSEVAATESRSRSEPQTDEAGEDAVAAAAGTGSATAGRDANGAAAIASNAAASNRSASQMAQSQTAATQNQQNTGQAAAKGNRQTNTTASVVNNNLHSQSNTALTSGSAVIALQSVDPKTSDPAGKPLAFDVLANAQSNDSPEATAAVNNGKTAAQLAKLRQAEGTAQVTGNQAVGNGAQAQNAQSAVAAVTQQAASNTAASLGSEAAGNTVSSTPAAGSGTPSFTSLAPVGGVTQTANATGAGAAASGNAASGAATPSEQVAVEIHKGIAAGKDSITIKLNPAELGKIDVKMELSDDGTLRAVIAVDRPETLDLLQKDIRGLERALQNAGLQADSGSLNFSLRGDGDNQAGGFETASGSDGNAGASGEEGSTDDSLTNAEQPNRSSHNGALDISV